MFKLGLDPDRRPGYALLFSTEAAGYSGVCRCKILRKGLALGSLGTRGWQIAEYEWEFKTADKSGFLAIEITPPVVRYMENANYVFEIRCADMNYEAIVPWMGIPSFREEDFLSLGSKMTPDETDLSRSNNNIGMLDDLFGGGLAHQATDNVKTEGGSEESLDNALDISMSPRRSAQKIRCHQCGDYRFDTKDACPWCFS